MASRHIVRDWRLLVDSVSTEYRVALERARRGEELALVETLLGNNKLVITGVYHGNGYARVLTTARVSWCSRQVAGD
jgi:hypothetical protein